MTKKERYFAIAVKYKPEGVEAVPVQKDPRYLAIAYTDEEFDEEGNEMPRKMEVPMPDTLGRLWTYLHECAHFRLNHRNAVAGTNVFSRHEAEARLETLRIFDEEDLIPPLATLKHEYEVLGDYALEDAKEGIEPHPTLTRCLEEFDRRIKAAEAPGKRRRPGND